MEIWKDIEGYEGLYQVSNLGRVKSLERYVGAKNNTKKLLKTKLLKNTPNNYNGYLSVLLAYNSVNKRFYVHRLVAMAFLNKPKDKDYINHLDGDKHNNHFSNLQWVSAKENTQHGIKTGLIDKCGEKHHNSKLKNEDVYKIRQLLGEGKTHQAIAEMFGVCRQSITCINKRYTWTHI